MKYESLFDILTQAGLQTFTLESGDGKVLILPRGGRVLGAFAGAEAANAFWTNEEISTVDRTKAFLARNDDFCGGDRMWLAPELGLFFQYIGHNSPPTPAEIDPSHYTVANADQQHVKLAATMTTPYHLIKNGMINVQVERTIRVAVNPFQNAANVLPELSRVRYTGYEVATKFELVAAPSDDLAVGPWFLIQLPACGHAYIPTRGRAVVTDYFEPIGPAHLRVDDAAVRFRIDGLERHKIGVRKNEVIGRMGYLKDADAAANSTLVVRNFFNNPSGNYADVPMHTPIGTQDSLQCYNHYSGPGSFGEIEFHAPSVCRRMAEPVRWDINQVWVFTGSRQDLTAVASSLLGLPRPTFA